MVWMQALLQASGTWDRTGWSECVKTVWCWHIWHRSRWWSCWYLLLGEGRKQRPSKVVYDRAGSSIATATTADFDWDKIFDGADWFHFTGITPALGDNVAAICLEACKAAKAKGITVSCDLNYRNKLWSKKSRPGYGWTLQICRRMHLQRGRCKTTYSVSSLKVQR